MANEPALWGEMLDVLKDIGEYLSKQDAKQEQAKIDKPPKISEGQKPIKGGEAPGFAPGKDALVQKEFPGVVNEPRENETSIIDAKEGTLLKEEDWEGEDEGEGWNEDEMGEGEDEEGEGIPPEEEDEELELKSLLKDIRNALNVIKSSKTSASDSKTKEKTKSSKSDSITKSMVSEVVAEIKKSLPSMMNAESQRMLRKMGFSPTRPDVVRFGVDEDIKKSMDSEGNSNEVGKIVGDLSNKSWSELGQLREKTGGFNYFR